MSWLPWTRESKELIDRTRSLKGIPIVNDGVTTEEQDGGRLLITVTLKRESRGMAAFLTPKTFHRRARLDELGRFTFGLIDGKRDVREVIDLFQKHYNVNRREAELSCVEFLKLLASRHIISIAIK